MFSIYSNAILPNDVSVSHMTIVHNLFKCNDLNGYGSFKKLSDRFQMSQGQDDLPDL